MKRDDYIAGGHHLWVHFWCGLVFGVIIGDRISSGLFDSRWACITSTAATGLVVALCCGRWGDSAWEWIGKLRWWP
jgi:hypothetical protein